jgi:hypothetical protein
VSAAASAPAAAASVDLGGKTPKQILDLATTNVKNTSSLHIKGAMKQDGDSMNIDMYMAKGKGCHGSMGVGSTGNFDIVSTGSTVWLKLDASFIKSLSLPAAAAASLKGKFVKTTTDDKTFSTFAGFCDPSTFSGGAGSDNSGYTRTGSSVVNGVPVMVLTSTSDKSRVLVATTGEVRVLRVTGLTAADGSVDFDYDTPVTVTPPPASQVIDAGTVGL